MDSRIDHSGRKQAPCLRPANGVFRLFAGAGRSPPKDRRPVLARFARVLALSAANPLLRRTAGLVLAFLMIFKPLARVAFTVALEAVFVFRLLWISPQGFFGFAAPRTEGIQSRCLGFESTRLLGNGGAPFPAPGRDPCRRSKRDFLARVSPPLFHRRTTEFDRVPLGTFSPWLSFGVVTAGFTFVHAPADWVAAAITGALYNLVAYRTKSLSSCVLAHAVTNLLLGLWIMKTRQWGFW